MTDGEDGRDPGTGDVGRLGSLEESERRLRQMAESIGEVFYLHEPDLGDVLYLNPAFEEIWGRPVEEVYEDPGVWLESVHPDDRERVIAEATAREATGFELEYRIVRPDGEVRWIRDRGFPVTDESGEPVRVAGVARDVTEQKTTELRLRRERERYRALFENANDAIVVADLDQRILEVNDAFCELSGYGREELEGARTVDFYVEPERRDELMAALRGEGRVRDFEVLFRRKDGEPRLCLLTASVLTSGFETPRIQATIRDVTEEVRHREAIEHEAMHDWLTGLPNRALFRDRLGQALRRAGRSGEPVGLLFADLNGFKAVNDRHGHRAGDRVLVETARRLSEAVRDPDTVARIGGDEFVVLLPDVSGWKEAGRVARRIRRAFGEPIEAEGVSVPMTVAVGVALAADEGDDALPISGAASDPDELLDRADRAMYRAKGEAKEEARSVVRAYRATLDEG